MPPAPRALHDRIAEKIDAPRVSEQTMRDVPRRVYELLRLLTFDPEVCWFWTGAYSVKRNGNRRPVVQYGRRGSPTVNVLRITLSLLDGVPLDERRNLNACHRPPCADPRCVNPFHAYWGTNTENHQDRVAHAPETFQRKDRRT